MKKQQLIQALESKVRTTFIGSLDSIEQHFGVLWGFNVDDEEKLTERQRLVERTWKSLREEILTKGNLQLRQVKNEVDLFLEENNYDNK